VERGRRTGAGLATLAVALIGCLALAAFALAARPATKAERAEITRLIHHDHSGDIAKPGKAHVLKILVSTKSPWASAELVTHFPGEGPGGGDYAGALLKRGAGGYRIVRIGSDAIGCGLISNAISEELDLGRCR
jgi:hypothetical protein